MDILDWTFIDLAVLLCIIVCYGLATYSYKRCRGHALATPLLLSSVLASICLFYMEIDIQQYGHGAQLLTWLLGPVTILLAVPLYQQLSQARNQLAMICLPVIAGGLSAPLLAYLLIDIFELEPGLKLAMLTKSITTPLALETATSIGAYPQLAAVFVSITGIIGALCAGRLFAMAGIQSEQAQGLALGTSSHAIGTVKALQISDKSGAYSSMALCINGILTSIILPLLMWWFAG